MVDKQFELFWQNMYDSYMFVIYAFFPTKKTLQKQSVLNLSSIYFPIVVKLYKNMTYDSYMVNFDTCSCSTWTSKSDKNMYTSTYMFLYDFDANPLHIHVGKSRLHRLQAFLSFKKWPIC